jgi:hypothetical protein
MMMKTSVVPNDVSISMVEGEEERMLLIDNDNNNNDNKKNDKWNAYMSATH